MARQKGTPNKPKKVELNKSRKVKEVIKDLDEVFGIDEVIDLDDLIDNESKGIIDTEGITDSIGTTENLHKQTHTEKPKSLGERLFDTEIGKFTVHMINTYGITEDREVFLLKFKYYLLKENVDLSALTFRRLMKFLREYQSYDIIEVQKVLMSL